MNLLRIFRHGPLLFWCAATLALGSVLSLGLSRGEPFTASETLAADSVWSDVESWRASLAQLPLLASSGEVSGFAKTLASVAMENAKEATSAGETDLAEAWSSAAEAANRLADSEGLDQDHIQAAVRAVSLAGDRLAAVASGSSWIPANLPESLDIHGPSETGDETSGLPADRLAQ